MNSQQLSKLSLPDEPGVYSFIKDGTILYIGKATSLKDRVKSYFSKDLALTRGPRITQMVDQADAITFQTADSVLEALILEAILIKKHQPYYNVREKDDKSWWYVGITKEKFSRVLMIRGKQFSDGSIDPDELAKTYGPFLYATELREALKIIRKIFPFRDRCLPAPAGRPCFNAQIGLCPGVCAGFVSATDYQKNIRHIKLFFEGKKSELVRLLNREMKAYAKQQEFELADRVKRQLFAINHIRDVALLKANKAKDASNLVHAIFRVEAYDIAHHGGKETVGAMTVVEDGETNKSQYRKFKIHGPKARSADDTANLEEVIRRRLKHPEWPLPDLIVVDGSKAQLNRMTKVLEAEAQVIPVVAVVKDEHHRPREILGPKPLIHDYEAAILLANAEVHRFALAYHRKLSRRMI